MPMNLNSNRAAPASQGCEMRHGVSSTVTVTVTVASQTADTRISSSNLYRQARAAPGPALHDLKAFKLPPDPGPSLVNWKLEHLQTVAGRLLPGPRGALARNLACPVIRVGRGPCPGRLGGRARSEQH